MSWLDKARHKFHLGKVLTGLHNHPILINQRKRKREEEDGADYFSDSDDEWCNEVALDGSSTKQEGGGVVTPPLFTFTLKKTALPLHWKKTVHKTCNSADLRQQRDAREGDNLAVELTDAIHRALLSSLRSQTLHDNNKIHFTLQADAFTAASNHCFQSATFTVNELESGSVRLDTYLHKLSQQLNLSQSFSKGDSVVYLGHNGQF